jgi:mannose-1-phosphate guanylyltransferase/mannose-1-phosphate guanylyltransferase/phosphomannomutase
MNDENIRAMILAAGMGSRLQGLTKDTPKVLFPIGGLPVIQYTLAWLKHYKITEVAVNLHYHGEKIQDYLQDGSRFGIKIEYSKEEELLGTAGAVKKMHYFFQNTFVVAYGDVLVDFNLTSMMDFHKKNDALGTIVLFQSQDATGVGVVEIDRHNRITSFEEKSMSRREHNMLINGGIYILEPKSLQYIPDKEFCDFAYDIFPKLIKMDLPLYGFILQNDDYLIDMGTIDKYSKANKDIEKRKFSYSYNE